MQQKTSFANIQRQILRKPHSPLFGTSNIRTLLLCLFLFIAPLSMVASAQEKVKTTVFWQGSVSLEKSVNILPAQTLRIAKGTTVTIKDAKVVISISGGLLIEGTKTEPVIFTAPTEWSGISLHETKGDVQVSHTQFSGIKSAFSCIASAPQILDCSFTKCGTAIKLVREASPTIERSIFIGNKIGVDNSMKSNATIRNSTFTNHSNTAIIGSNNTKGKIEFNKFYDNNQAIAVVKKYPDEISNNHFRGNKVGIYCNQTQSTPQISNNRFEKNEAAIVNFSFSYPIINNNRFLDNGIAVRNDQYGSPLVEHNLFRNNKTAIYNYRKSNPKIKKNIFEKNGLSLYCDYSAYPLIRQNNFSGNTLEVKLGPFQSSDWEKKNGSKEIIAEKAMGMKSRNPLIGQIPTKFNDYVDVSGNWWGANTETLNTAPAEANIAIFYDRADEPYQVYPGFGPDRYATDWVKYIPWLPQAISNAGPRP